MQPHFLDQMLAHHFLHIHHTIYSILDKEGPILINNEVKEVVATPKIAEISTEAGYDISPQVLKEINAPDQPLNFACIRPT